MPKRVSVDNLIEEARHVLEDGRFYNQTRALSKCMLDALVLQQAVVKSSRELLRWHRNEGSDTDEPSFEFTDALVKALEELDRTDV